LNFGELLDKTIPRAKITIGYALKFSTLSSELKIIFSIPFFYTKTLWSKDFAGLTLLCVNDKLSFSVGK